VLQLFLNHALRDGYFPRRHAPGQPEGRAQRRHHRLDFGIMGRIDEYTRRVYAEILYGFIRKDYRRVAEVHFEAGYVPADRDVDEFARRCARWASRSSAWMPAASRWGGC
jgi:ubiquinone biosynthesis protein